MFRRLFTKPLRPTRPLRRNSLTLVQLEAREVPAFAGGVNIAVGDVNGDGFPDVVTGQASQGPPLVRVTDGATGNLTAEFQAYEGTFTGGVYVATGDVDGDGIDEIITGTGNGGGPNVVVFDGRNAQAKYSFFPYESSFRGGVIVAAGDTDGDGIDEIITGTGVGGGPRVQVLNATTQQPLLNFFAYEDKFRGGVLVGAGDTNGDGKVEVITGTGVGGGPRVSVFDAKTKTALQNFFAYEPTFRGGVSVGAGDLDGDGKAEVLTGSGPGGGPVVTAFQFKATESMARFLAFDGNFRGGVSITAADMTGDGRAEFLAGSGRGSGVVGIFSPDGASNLVSFAPFDSSFPGRAISANAKDPSFSRLPFMPDVGLSVSASSVITGTNQQLVFTARADSLTLPSKVKLYEADASGKVGAFLLDLFDDGSFTHRDVIAKDGKFSNTFTVNFPTAGDRFYAARVTVNGKDQVYRTHVTALAPPSADGVATQATQSSELQTTVLARIAAGAPATVALEEAKAALLTNPTLAQPSSITVTGRGVEWRTPEGIGMSVLSTVGANSTEKDPSDDGGGGGGGGTQLDGLGNVLVLAPYFDYFEGHGGDESDDIAAAFQAKGYGVTTQYNSTVTIDSFRSLGQYDAVVISSHGDAAADGSNTVLFTGVDATAVNVTANMADLIAGRLRIANGELVLTPAFFSTTDSQMNGTVVYLSACRSARSTSFASSFLNNGAEAFAGYSDYVSTGFAVSHGIGMFNHLLSNGTYNSIPGIGDIEADADPARFRVFARSPIEKLVPGSEYLQDYDLAVTYTWPTTQRDLDTGTLFLDQTVGYAAPGGASYMTFTGDNTSSGGAETATVKLYDSYLSGEWSGSVQVFARAGWFIPAGGSGPATVTVALRHKTTGELKGAMQRSINPGEQNRLAETVVGIATVHIGGPAGEERVFFTFA